MEEDKFSKIYEQTMAGINAFPNEIKQTNTILSDYLIEQNDLYDELLNYKENTIYENFEYIEYIQPKFISETKIYENSKPYDLGKMIIKNSLIFDEKFNDINSLNNVIKLSTIPQGNLKNRLPFPSANLSGYYNFDSILAEDLPEMALPVIEFIKDKKPHVVIGCDRGGRMFSLAIHATWKETEDQPFPTIDSKIHFTRISKSEDESVLQEKVDTIIEQARLLAEQRGSGIEEDEQLRVLFVDDWVCGGGTVRLCERLMKKHGAETYFAVMVGPGADVSGDSVGSKSVNWSDDPQAIGVNYLSSMTTDEHGNIKQELEVVAVRGSEAIRNRKKIHAAAKELAKASVEDDQSVAA